MDGALLDLLWEKLLDKVIDAFLHAIHVSRLPELISIQFSDGALACYRGDLGSIPDLLMCDIWWVLLPKDGFSTRCSVSYCHCHNANALYALVCDKIHRPFSNRSKTY
jgi:hypothetical protein